uniref:RNase III domain-containing protein n=1 Tax=Panagrolaimus sp. PS1159 TaxID=55785 RepID=A0AC35GX26_9BILA
MAFKFSSVMRSIEKVFMKLAVCDLRDYKRFQTIGESFMKLSVTEFSFHMWPNETIKSWHEHRENQISDQNLAKLGKEYGIERLMTSTSWVPDEYKLGVTSRKKIKEDPLEVSDEQIAECVKALCGTYLIIYEPHKARMFLKGLKLDVITTKPVIEGSKNGAYTKTVDEIYNKMKLNKLETAIGYSFNDKSLLIRAFTHPRYIYSSIIGNFRPLEFYGDAVLDYLTNKHLFEYGISYNHKMLRDLRSSLTCNDTFDRQAVEFELDMYFLCDFETFNREKYFQTPKNLADFFESLAAAVYLDSQMNLPKTRKVFFKLLGPLLDKVFLDISSKPIQELMKNHKIRHIKRRVDKDYLIVHLYVDDIEKSFTAYGISYLNAEIAAATKALNYFKELDITGEKVAEIKD